MCPLLPLQCFHGRFCSCEVTKKRSDTTICCSASLHLYALVEKLPYMINDNIWWTVVRSQWFGSVVFNLSAFIFVHMYYILCDGKTHWYLGVKIPVKSVVRSGCRSWSASSLYFLVSLFSVFANQIVVLLFIWSFSLFSSPCPLFFLGPWLFVLVGPPCFFSRTARFFRTTKWTVVLTTRIGGSYKTKTWTYINNGSNCKT